ncbi:cytochrome bd-I ubiquinol oxidase subunit 1 apoprotein [Thalassolituus maritimus]|uniref:Cytochrome bd-I ubiquinol oxidase subunit 1 apoprotein n=1 Tax=Thalassolituus maritimus TaxID=484498 RepID=A0A1N7JRN9_9GAMM|nr:cytochrome ubiquinol oxidase subunit I [Thalassolituus maritimus]SIS51975.1 cytochrome bd-I ubiquinol oxidase subunit 1 apoprotein [Thalassolituus maritimus]
MEFSDPFVLARAQFAANITFHILFPTITIALGWLLVYFKLRYRYSGADHWMGAYRFFVKVFALCFALGVVSGITMSFQFGTNWPGFMESVGNIAGPLLAYEILTAFFMEAVFLGIMLFGSRRVSERVHTLATLLVAIGTTLSAFWILVLNSWMHTPAGFEMRDGVAYATDWLSIIFNPSMPYRLVHMLLASGLTAAFLVAGVSAYRWLRGDRETSVIVALKTGTWLAAILIPLQILAGDLHGLNTLEHQPEKIAAMEGLWETERGAALRIFAIPDEEERTNHFEIAVPGLASLILTHDPEGEVRGLNSFETHPPMAPLFFSFRIMIAVGVLMLIVSWLAAWQLQRHKAPAVWTARVLVAMTFSGWIATVAGWYTTEIGRQPWLVQGVLLTEDAVAHHSGVTMAGTFIAYVLIYVLLLIAFISTVFYMARRAGHKDNEAPVSMNLPEGEV